MPGASDASAVKLRLAIGRFSTALGRDRERSLAARRLDDRRFGLDRRSRRAADFHRQRADRARVAGAHGDARPLQPLKPAIVTWMVYVSAGTLTNTKSPVAPVTTGADSCRGFAR